MSIFRISDTQCIEKLFANWPETMIWSCLQGYMGNAWADSDSNPKSAQIVVADFCIFAGDPNVDLLLNKPKEHKSDFIIMIPQSVEWEDLIEQYYKERAKRILRYAIKKESNIFKKKDLKEIVDNIREPFHIQRIDKDIFYQISNLPWARDLCAQFKDYNDYNSRGLGVVAVMNGEVVSGASSYTVYREGIEIEIDTREDYRRNGLALACGAQLILECLERGLYPSWDAQNLGSVALAEKLGYHFDKEYTAYEIIGY